MRLTCGASPLAAPSLLPGGSAAHIHEHVLDVAALLLLLLLLLALRLPRPLELAPARLILGVLVKDLPGETWLGRSVSQSDKMIQS